MSAGPSHKGFSEHRKRKRSPLMLTAKDRKRLGHLDLNESLDKEMRRLKRQKSK